MIAMIQTLLLPPSSALNLLSRQKDCRRTRQHHRRQLDGEDQENQWRSDWSTRPGRSATDKDWRRQEDGLPRIVGYPESPLWQAASEPIMDFTRSHGTTALLTRLATGQVTESFEEEPVARLKEQVVRALADQGLHLNRKQDDRQELLVDCRFLQPLLNAEGQPRRFRAGSSRRTRVRLPRQPALYPRKEKVESPETVRASQTI